MNEGKKNMLAIAFRQLSTDETILEKLERASLDNLIISEYFKEEIERLKNKIEMHKKAIAYIESLEV